MQTTKLKAISSREMLCTFYGALHFVDNIPDDKKSLTFLRIAEKTLGIRKEEAMEMLEGLDKTLDYIYDKAGGKPIL